MEMGIYPSVIASPDLSGCGNPYSQYITGISPVIKKYFKIFPQKRRIFGIYVVYKIYKDKEDLIFS